jgi:hypothetical protein
MLDMVLGLLILNQELVFKVSQNLSHSSMALFRKCLECQRNP